MYAFIVPGLAWQPPHAEKVNSFVSEATTIAGILIVLLPHSTQIPLRYIKMGYSRGSTKKFGSSGNASDSYSGGFCSNLGPTEGFIVLLSSSKLMLG
jgi:hypothetical protein